MKRKNQEGAIVIEATIALTAFMFLVVTILAMINICLVQTKVGTLTHGVAKDISNYSYLYSMTGVGATEKDIASKAEYSKHSLDEVIHNSSNVYDAVSKTCGLVNDGEFWSSFGNLLKAGAIDQGKGTVINGVCQKVAEKRLKIQGVDADTYLRRMGITEGVSGLDFTRSEFCSGGDSDIKIICRYKVHALKLLNINVDFHFQQCAYTKAWAAPEKTSSGSGSSGDNEFLENNEKEQEKKEKEEEEQEEATTEKQEENKTLEELVQDSTHNPDSKQVMLGLYKEYYDGHAENTNMTYFSMDEETYNKLKSEGKSWEANRRFLENQYSQGKDFYLASDPNFPEMGTYSLEVEWLRQKGYTFKYDGAVGYWKAVKE